MKSNFKFSPLVLAVVGLVGLLIYLNMPKEQGKNDRRGGSSPVVIHEVQNAEFEVTVEALGTAKANEAVSLTAQQSDIIQAITFEDGEIVKKGQLLLTLYDREEKAKVNELEINVQEAKRQLNRIINLAKESVASEQRLDEQQAKVKALQAQLDVANAKLAELELRAPFDGVLGIRQVSVGALVRPGDVITTLDDIQQVKVDFNIAEIHLPSVSVGQNVRAKSVAYPGEVFEGKISSIDSRIDPVTRAIQVRAIIANQDYKLRPGMLLQIDLQKQLLNTLIIPEKALLPIEDRQYVYVVQDGKAIRKEVTVGRRKPGIAQILDGIEAGEQVVTEGTLRIRDGASVSVISGTQ